MKIDKKLKGWFQGIIATGLAIVAMSIFAKIVWDAWDQLITYLVSEGFPPAIEYVLGALLFVAGVWLGAVELNKIKKKI